MPKKSRIRASAENVESGRVPEKGRIQTSAGKVEIRASAGKGQNPGEFWKSGNPG